MKRIRNILVIVVVIALSLWLFSKIKSLPAFSDLFKPKKVTIANSPVAVKQIQALAQLVTVSMYEELVVDSSINHSKILPVPLLPNVMLYNDENTLVIVGKLTAHVGIDMQQLSNLDISGSKDSIYIVLPAAEVLDVIINPSDVSIFIEKGDWNNEAVTNLKRKMQTIAIADAKSRGLLLQSEKKAKEILTRFFTAAGYKTVVIQFKEESLQIG